MGNGEDSPEISPPIIGKTTRVIVVSFDLPSV